MTTAPATEAEDLADVEAIAARLPENLAGVALSVAILERDEAGRIAAVSITAMGDPA